MLSAWLPGGADGSSDGGVGDGRGGGAGEGISDSGGGGGGGVNGDGGRAVEVAVLVRAASEATGLDLLRLGTVGVAEEIRDTAVAQPLIVLASLSSAMHHGLLPEADGTAGQGGASEPGRADVVAGHSLGALTALALAGALTPVEAVTLAARRGAAMAECCQMGEPGGMCALLGGNRAEVLAAIEAAGLCAANVNGSTQVVAAGPLRALGDLRAPAGVRVVRLDVAGAFHSPVMAAAAPLLAAALSGLPERVLLRAVVDEATGEVHPAGEFAGPLLTGLVGHLTAPVRWDLVQESLLQLGVSEAVELAPAGALAGFARRDLPGVAVTRLR